MLMKTMIQATSLAKMTSSRARVLACAARVADGEDLRLSKRSLAKPTNIFNQPTTANLQKYP